ncbi:MAG: hypothetical protein KAH98_05465 [Dehalococcoidia bacterium]|nr:hypothetical protein [Dehalococcoidia bacterium]
MADNQMKEQDYYPLVKEAIEDHFKNKGYFVDFEVHGRKKPHPRFLFKNATLSKCDRRTLPTPDIMGLIWTQQKRDKKLIIAEFKKSPRFADIFQAKGYDELFNSDYTLLLGLVPISESSKSTMAFIRNNPELLKTKRGESEIYVKFLHPTREGAITLAQLASEIGILPDEDTKLLFDLLHC